MCKSVSSLAERHTEIAIHNPREESELKLLITKCGIDLNRSVTDQRSAHKQKGTLTNLKRMSEGKENKDMRT